MLPVSPYYPGLEMITSAISTTTGLGPFYAGNIVILAARVLMGLASELQNSDLLDAAILSHFQHMEENHLDDPDLLLEVPDVDRSVLIYVLFGANGVGQAQWEARSTTPVG